MIIERPQIWIGSGCLVASTIAIFVAFGMVDSSQSLLRAKQREAAPAGYEMLQRSIAERNRTWLPQDKDRLLEQLRGKARRMEPAILWVLAHNNHELLEPTMVLAADLEISSSRPLLASLATTGPAALRPNAIRFAERLAPWDEYELLDLLATEVPAVQIAALECCARHDERPTNEILHLLGSDHEEVREAAVLALPTDLSPPSVTELLNLADGSDAAAECALQALTRIHWSERTEATLLDLLTSAPVPAQCAILQAIAERGTPPSQPEQVWDLVTSRAATPIVRALALWCLEATESFDPDAVRDELPVLPPLAQYVAARCLIKAGNLEGIDALLDLAMPLDENGELFPAGAQQAQVAAKQLLAHLSQTPLHAGMDTWRAWYASLTEIQVGALPAPPVHP